MTAFNDIARVTLVYRGTGGQEINNVIHTFNAGHYGTHATLLSLATAIAALWDDAAFTDYINTNLELVECRAAGVGVPVPAPAVVAVGVSGTHTGADAMPANVTAAVKLSTSLGGRSGRGRVYHPSLSENQVAGDLLGSGVAAGLVSAWTHVLPLLGWSDGSIPGVASFIEDGEPRAEPEFNNLAAITCDGVVDSQRRRLTGRGR